MALIAVGSTGVITTSQIIASTPPSLTLTARSWQACFPGLLQPEETIRTVRRIRLTTTDPARP